MSSFHCSSFIIFATFFIFVYIYHFTSRGVLLRILMPFLYRSTTINICIIKNAFRVNVATAHVSHLSTKIQVWSSANYEVRFNPSLILDVKGAFRQHRFHFFFDASHSNEVIIPFNPFTSASLRLFTYQTYIYFLYV